MFDYKFVLTILAIAAGFIGYVLYIRNILSGKAKPHAFSWFVWALIACIAFSAQVAGKGGHGALIMGFTALACIIIALLALFKGKRDFPLFDWFCLISAFAAIGLWLYTKNPVSAVVLITITEVFAFMPTFRKGYFKPHEETATTFGLSGLTFFLSLFALDRFTVTTALYPAALVATNFSFVAMLLIRRRMVG